MGGARSTDNTGDEGDQVSLIMDIGFRKEGAPHVTKSHAGFYIGEYHDEMKRLIDPHHAHFITFSTYRRLPLFQTDAHRNAFSRDLAWLRGAHDFKLYAWVLMPNHTHLLIREHRTGDIGKLLRVLKIRTAKHIIGRWRKLEAPVLNRLLDHQGRHRLWQYGGGYDRNIVAGSEFKEKLGYIHMNPVRAGLVVRPIDWAWSSARWWSGDRKNAIDCDHW